MIMPIRGETKNLNNVSPISSVSNPNAYPGKPIAETILNGFFTVDDKWTVKYWNKAAEKLMGVTAKDIVGKNLWEKFSAAIPIKFYAVLQEAFSQDLPVHFEEYYEEMGAWFNVITYYCDDTLSVSFKTSSAPEHSQRLEQPEQQLRILNELYRFMAEVTNDCLWEWDFHTKELFWIDGGHKRVFGYQVRNALIPQAFWENCLHPADKARVLTGLNKIITERAGDVWEDEYRFRKADGDYAYVHDRGFIIYDEETGASRMIGATLDITARRKVEIQLLESERKKQKEITAAVLTAQEKERADIGKELHDNLNQVLGAAKLYIEMARTDDDNRDSYLDKSSGYIVAVIEEIRKISKTLASPGLHLMGLFESINILLDDLVAIQPIRIDFQENGLNEEHLDEKLQLDIFRIVQEQLNNIMKHSGATQVTISLARQENEIILLIYDNGQGCDLSKERKGVGIINIRSRAELYRGKVSIASKPGEGYELRVVLHLNGRV